MVALLGHPWLRLAVALAVLATISLFVHPERGHRPRPSLSLPGISMDDLHRQYSRRMRDSIKAAAADSDNRNSLYAWTWSYFALGCLKAAQATHETRFLNLVSRDLRTIAAHRDDRLNIRDVPLDRVLPAWGAVLDGDPWHNGPAINGRIVYVIARFAEVRKVLGVSDHQA